MTQEDTKAKMVEIRSALRHLHEVICDGESTAGKSQEAIDRLASEFSTIFGEDFSDLEAGDSYGEIEWLRWAVGGCQDLLGFTTTEEMEEAISEGNEE